MSTQSFPGKNGGERGCWDGFHDNRDHPDHALPPGGQKRS